MAQDIVPIELGLPQGDVVTLWAPRWREDGEDWEAFLGHEEDLYAFADSAHLAAFVRSGAQHDLDDHPAWHVVPTLPAIDLSPDEAHQYDLVGVPELVAEPPDTWTLAELADIVEITRSLAEVCELDKVREVLDAAAGFQLLPHGTLAFSGKEGQRRWNRLREVVAERWDELLDAVDGVVRAPEVSQQAVETAEAELAEVLDGEDGAAPATAEASDVDTDEEPDEDPGFWGEVGIDPVRITTSAGDRYTLRCFLGDDPVFLGSAGVIDVFDSPEALGRFLADEQATAGNDLAQVATWPTVLEAARSGDLEVAVSTDNTYALRGLDEDLAQGPSAVDAHQLELAEELLTDAAAWAGDETTPAALHPSERLGWLVSFVLRPTPNRLPPSPPFDAEVASWLELVTAFEQRLRDH